MSSAHILISGSSLRSSVPFLRWLAGLGARWGRERHEGRTELALSEVRLELSGLTMSVRHRGVISRRYYLDIAPSLRGDIAVISWPALRRARLKPGGTARSVQSWPACCKSWERFLAQATDTLTEPLRIRSLDRVASPPEPPTLASSVQAASWVVLW